MKKVSGKANRAKGFNAERLYAKIFRSFGYKKCITSRHGSKFYDDLGIDLINIPFHVQIKAGKQTGLNISKTLYNIHRNVLKFINHCKHLPIILIHRKEVGRGKKRNDYDDIVSMSFKDFRKLLLIIKNEDYKKRKF